MAEPAQAPIAARPALGAHVRPLSVGDLLDVALRLYRAHFRPLFALALVFEAPVYLLGKVYQSLTRELLPTSTVDPQATARALEHLDPGVLALLPVVLLGILLLGVVLQGTLDLAGNAAWHGRPVRLGHTLREVLGRVPALLGTSLLMQLLLGLSALGAALPGLALAVGGATAGSVGLALLGFVASVLLLLAAVLVLYLRWFLYAEAVVLEGRAGPAALRRSRALMAGSVEPGFFGRIKVRASLVLLVVFFVSLVPGLLVGIPLFVLMAIYAPAPGVLDPASIPLLFRLPLEALQLLASGLVAPFGVLAVLAFWFDLRVRREGYDLELRASALGEAG